MMETITDFTGMITVVTVFVMSNVNGYYFWNDNYNWYNQGSGLAPVMVMITITESEMYYTCACDHVSKVKLEDVSCIFSTYLLCSPLLSG